MLAVVALVCMEHTTSACRQVPTTTNFVGLRMLRVPCCVRFAWAFRYKQTNSKNDSDPVEIFSGKSAVLYENDNTSRIPFKICADSTKKTENIQKTQ